MAVNGRNKTKEMLIASIIKDAPPTVPMHGIHLERVMTLKLLVVHVANDLKMLTQSRLRLCPGRIF